MNLNKTTAKRTAVAAVAMSAALGLAACSSDSGTSSSAGTSTSAAAATESTVTNPEPIATIPAISGGDTAVALDQGFLDAITGLGVTPGVIGGATLEGTTLDFPITGGTATVYDKDSGYRPFVQGAIFHQGSGISLTAGANVIQLENFVVVPSKPAILFADVSVNGELAAPSFPLFNLNGTTLEPVTVDSSGNAILTGTKVEVSPAAAEFLNTTLGAPGAVPDNFLVGVATLTIPTA
ncbi:hypothetical protein SAMN03159343_1013 [Klenkia marina]|uniref:Uncharacterized protein n=1 Tax=Klenkia marina TaxID=1960309 RepID=A0A1G4XJ41_9ACTN|nr:hypothetical protein [Klenkia marina]SCX40678.1 hypothetical protein SAMN03159343_1013 [Klenkia marina]